MNPLVRVSVIARQSLKPEHQAVGTGYLLQRLAASLYENGDVPLRCFLFPYVDLLQLEMPENAIFFGNFLQFYSPTCSSFSPAVHEAAIWNDFDAWLRRHNETVKTTCFSLCWETAPLESFWPSNAELSFVSCEKPGQEVVFCKLSPPSFPSQRVLSYRAFARNFLSVCQIFHRLLQGNGGTLLLFSPFQICYSAPAECLEKLNDYLLPELKKLGFSVLYSQEKR